jgi:hypothetical protein
MNAGRPPSVECKHIDSTSTPVIKTKRLARNDGPLPFLGRFNLDKGIQRGDNLRKRPTASTTQIPK